MIPSSSCVLPIPRNSSAKISFLLSRTQNPHGGVRQLRRGDGRNCACWRRDRAGAAPPTPPPRSPCSAGSVPGAPARGHPPFVRFPTRPAAAAGPQIEGDARGARACAGDGAPTWGDMVWGLHRSTAAAQTLTLARRHLLFQQSSPEAVFALVAPSRPPAGRRPRFESPPAAPGACLGFSAPATGPRPPALARHPPFVRSPTRPAAAAAPLI